jgi:hypothetical protein
VTVIGAGVLDPPIGMEQDLGSRLAMQERHVECF